MSDSAGVWNTRQTGELSDHRIQNLGMESRSCQQALNSIDRVKDDNLQAIITSEILQSGEQMGCD